MKALIATALCCLMAAAPVMASEDWAPLANPELDLSIWVPPPVAEPNDGIMLPLLFGGAVISAGCLVVKFYCKMQHRNDTTIPCKIDVYELDGLTDSPELYASITLLSGPAFTNYWDAVQIPMKDRANFKVVITPLTNSIP